MKSFLSQYDVVVIPNLEVFILRSIEYSYGSIALQWCHNDHDGVSNHQPHGCLLNCLFRRRSKETSKLRATGLCVGNSPGPVNSPHKGPVTRKMFPFDDVIMVDLYGLLAIWCRQQAIILTLDGKLLCIDVSPVSMCLLRRFVSERLTCFGYSNICQYISMVPSNGGTLDTFWVCMLIASLT